MGHNCPWPTEGEGWHWNCHTKETTTMGHPYRQRHTNGEYDQTKPETKAAKAQTKASNTVAKTTKVKRSSK